MTTAFKVNINLKEVALKGESFKEIVIPETFLAIKGGDELCNPEYQYVTYIARKVRTDEGEDKYYYVKTDETGMFNELLKVRNSFIFDRINDGVEIIVRQKKLEKKAYITYIKGLPWYKRLLNKF